MHKNALPKPGRYEKGLGYESTSQNAQHFLYILLNFFLDFTTELYEKNWPLISDFFYLFCLIFY